MNYINLLKEINKTVNYGCENFGILYKKNLPIVLSDIFSIRESELLAYNIFGKRVSIWYPLGDKPNMLYTHFYDMGYLPTIDSVCNIDGINIKLIFQNNQYFYIKKNRLMPHQDFVNNQILLDSGGAEAQKYFVNFVNEFKNINVPMLDSIIKNINIIDREFPNYIVELDRKFNPKIHYDFLLLKDNVIKLKKQIMEQ
jgi:hypothetical protein